MTSSDPLRKDPAAMWRQTHTIDHENGRLRIAFFTRDDGFVMYREEILREDDDLIDPAPPWWSYRLESGLFDDIAEAQRDALQSFAWLREGTQSKLDELTTLLLSEWDPIEVKEEPRAATEYGAYAAQVYSMLKRGQSVEAVAAYLGHVATGGMGLPDNYERDLRVANLALSIYQL